ncbi:hypothetical protein BDM02DRAFT_3129901 [Thelephora ganbajun]|uniref:Uncharacterized protein n=1 Tax=Thelephora ganbajun TaxID=370292 RepID=A0ACB6ZC91_THEGA|nr:hypothetical protein BDM02DRAFT_3129901 [Thelephora ganbajun]
MSLLLTYAIVAIGLFLLFVIATSLTIRWRSRVLKAQRANAMAPPSVPGVIVPFDPAAPRPRNVYPDRPGSGNVELLLVGYLGSLSLKDLLLDRNSTPTLGGDTTSVSPLPSLNHKPQDHGPSQPPPAYTDVVTLDAHVGATHPIATA